MLTKSISRRIFAEFQEGITTTAKLGACISALFLFSVSVPTPLPARQAEEDLTPVVLKSADETWRELENVAQDGLRRRDTTSALSNEQALAEMLASAEAFKEFYTTYPDHASAAEAKRREALVLIQAWRSGDETQQARRKAAVSNVRKDPDIPAARRSEVAALADNIVVEKRAGLSLEARLEAYERVARGLVSEFPDLPDAYEALVHIAKDSSDAKASAIASHLLAWADAPAWVKQEAKALADRYALIGTSVFDLTKAIIARDNPFEPLKGRPIAIYTWATTHPPSLSNAKELTSKLTRDFRIVGICLDQRDLAPAKRIAQEEALPGEQIYDWLGRRGEVAEALGAVDPGLVYLADDKGIVRSVSAQRNLAAAMAAMSDQ